MHGRCMVAHAGLPGLCSRLAVVYLWPAKSAANGDLHYASLYCPVIARVRKLTDVLQLLMTRPRDEWRHDVTSRYRALEQFSKEDARLQFLRILRSLPYGTLLMLPLVAFHSTDTHTFPRASSALSGCTVPFRQPCCTKDSSQQPFTIAQQQESTMLCSW